MTLNKLSFKHAFTLVEILVSLVIISIMGTMVLTAVSGVTNTARIARTRNIIAACDAVIQEQYESYKFRPLPVEIPVFPVQEINVAGPPARTFDASFEVLTTEAARVRLIMTRDLQRMELPDKRLDIFDLAGNSIASGGIPRNAQPPVQIRAVANRVIANTDGTVLREYAANRQETNIQWNGSPTVENFRRRAIAKGANWSADNEGAECLYLIMASNFTSGSAAIDAIPSQNIGDTDGDGMAEILDGWGQPIQFIRWPVGFNDGGGLVDVSAPDDFDPFQVDFGFFVNGIAQPYALRPLIYSAGPDEIPGIRNSTNNIAYNLQTWALGDMDGGANTQAGNESQGRSANYRFPDPYLRQSPPSDPLEFPGAITVTEAFADNITNYNLQASF